MREWEAWSVSTSGKPCGQSVLKKGRGVVCWIRLNMGPNTGAKTLNQTLVWSGILCRLVGGYKHFKSSLFLRTEFGGQVSWENKSRTSEFDLSYWRHKGWGHFLNHYWCPDSQESIKVHQCQLLNQHKQTNTHIQKGNREIYSYSLCFRAEWAIQTSIMQNFLLNKLAIKWRLCTE